MIYEWGKFNSQRKLGAELKVKVGTYVGHFQYNSFGSGTSRNQVIMQFLLLSHSWRLQSFSVLLCIFCLGLNRSACFDESFSWSNVDWSCSSLGGVVADFLWSADCSSIEESNNVIECLPGLFRPLDMF